MGNYFFMPLTKKMLFKKKSDFPVSFDQLKLLVKKKNNKNIQRRTDRTCLVTKSVGQICHELYGSILNFTLRILK